MVLSRPRLNQISIALFSLSMAAVFVLSIAGCNTIDRDHGMRYYQLGEYENAGRIFEKITAKTPTDWQALYYLGLVRLQQGRPLQAQLLLEQAYQLEHNHVMTSDILDALAEALYQQERFTNLTAMLDDATQQHGTVRDYVRQGKYLGMSGDPDGAKLAFIKATRLAGPTDPSAYLAMADFYESIGDVPSTITALRKAYYIEASPSLSNRLQKYGVIPGPTAGLKPEDAQ